MTDQHVPQPPRQPVYYAPVAPVYVAPVAAPTNTLAVVSMIFGIAGWVVLPVIGALVAVITGHISLGQLKRGSEGGKGMAVTGVVLGWVQLGLTVLFVGFWVLLGLTVLGTAAGSGGIDS
jgi:hypothetical protein